MSNKNATTKILGFEYQKLIALLKCLKANDNSFIYLECRGDVSDDLSSIEIKHSINHNKILNDTHVDFWKTLGNIVEDYELLSTYSKFILHTTAKVKEGSIFSRWMILNSKRRAEEILKITPNTTIQKHYDKVKECKSHVLWSILERFEIEDQQYNITDLYEKCIVENDVIKNAVESGHRREFVNNLLGYIDSTLINSNKDNYKWEIDISDFRDSFRSIIKKYVIEDVIFPLVRLSDVNNENHEFIFTKKLRDIGYENQISFAVNFYLRAQKSRIKMIKARSSLTEELDVYDEEIAYDMKSLKAKHINKLKNGEYDSIERGSRSFYDDCMDQTQNKMNIEGVKGVRSYYPKGRVHYNAEDDFRFNWLLEKKDEG